MSVDPWSANPLIDQLTATDIHMRRTPSRTIKNQEGPPLSVEALFFVEYGMHTGWRSGLLASANADTTKFDMEAGKIIKVNSSPDPLNTVVTSHEIPETLGITDPFPSETFTHVFYNGDTGAQILRTTPISTLDDLTNLIYIAKLRKFGGVIVTIDNNPIISHGSSMSEIVELVFNGGVRLSGAKIVPNGANLQVDIPAGKLKQFGRGRNQDLNHPNTYQTSAQTPILTANFFKALVDGSGDLIVDNANNLLNPAQFNEDGLGPLVNVSPAGNYTIIRVRQVAEIEAVVFYYGTEKYSTLAGAMVAIEPTFEEHPDTIELPPIANIFVPGNMTDFAAALASGDAVIQYLTRR